jgi:sortase (surface protein transpeptidase)
MTPRRGRLLVAVAALVLAAGCSSAGAGPAASGATATTANGVDAARGFHSTHGYRGTPVPVRLEIPSIGVSTRLQRLGRDPDGSVQVPIGPHQWTEAGWYAEGTRPGDPGSAVILGHVDSTRGPGVFYRLRELGPGDRVVVVRADGSRVTFVVQRTEQYPKARFPTADVYYPTLTPMLRLVTCGGAFDRDWGHYVDNVIVFATLER